MIVVKDVDEYSFIQFFFLALALRYAHRISLLVFRMQYDDFEDSDGVTSEGKVFLLCVLGKGLLLSINFTPLNYCVTVFFPLQ